MLPIRRASWTVGGVVNKLPVDVDIKVEGAQDMWQDKRESRIGGKEPKLCSFAFFVLRRPSSVLDGLSKQVYYHFHRSRRPPLLY